MPAGMGYFRAVRSRQEVDRGVVVTISLRAVEIQLESAAESRPESPRVRSPKTLTARLWAWLCDTAGWAQRERAEIIQRLAQLQSIISAANLRSALLGHNAGSGSPSQSKRKTTLEATKHMCVIRLLVLLRTAYNGYTSPHRQVMLTSISTSKTVVPT